MIASLQGADLVDVTVDQIKIRTIVKTRVCHIQGDSGFFKVFFKAGPLKIQRQGYGVIVLLIQDHGCVLSE